MPNRIATHAIFALLAALLLATPGRAADVVAVRVGDHPTYTRVVFQLDAPAGYGIERRTAEDGTSEILVRMDAGSTPRSLDRRTVMVERISVEGGQDRSTARIRLRKSPSRVRELILTNPPRLTFDLVFPEPMLAAAKRRTAEKAALAQAPGAEPDPKAAPPSSAGKPTLKADVLPGAKPTLKADVLPGAKPTLKADVLPGAKPTLKADVPRGAKPDVPGTPGRAADVVAVRVGNHPTYTRVVFQLDAPAGYGIERRTAEDGTSEILVRMDAGSTPRSLDRRTVMVERISVEEGQDRSTARIRLRKNPSRVRELILTNPPRLAFDLVFPEPMLAAAKRRTAEKAALAQAPGAEPDPKAAPPSSAGKPTLKADVLRGVKPTLKADVPRGVKPTLKADVPRGAKPTLKADVLPGVKPTAEAVVPPGAKPEVLPGAKPTAKAVVPPGVKPEVLPGVKPTAEAVVPPGAKPRAKADVLPGVKPTASADVDWVFYGSFLAGGILLAIFVATWLRRRSLPSDVEVTAVANSVAADDRREIAATDGDSEASEATPEMPRAGFAGVEVDVARRLLEFERRVEQVEARLDTSSDTRERLERQVAAQGEELRVQRSAIARTQRALRSLSRGDAEEATEPARRDGDS